MQREEAKRFTLIDAMKPEHYLLNLADPPERTFGVGV